MAFYKSHIGIKMIIFIKLGKSLFILVPILFLVLVVHSIAHFKLGTQESIPRKLIKLLWPNPKEYETETSKLKIINIRGINLFLSIFFFVMIISFTLGNLYSTLIDGDSNGLNKKVIIVSLILGLIAAQRLVGAYMRYLRGGK